jgi:hypothetical protein
LFLPIPYYIDLSILTDTLNVLYVYYFCVSHWLQSSGTASVNLLL